MESIRAYTIISKTNDNILEEKNVYMILNKDLLKINEDFIRLLNNIYKNIKFKNNCFTDISEKKIINKINEDKNIYNYVYSLKIEKFNDYLNFDQTILVLRNYLPDLNTFCLIYDFYNDIYTNIKDKYNLKEKTLFYGLSFSKLLFDIFIKSILNSIKFKSVIYYYNNEFIFQHNDLYTLKYDKELFEILLKKYNLFFNYKYSYLHNSNNFYFLNHKILKTNNTNINIMNEETLNIKKKNETYNIVNNEIKKIKIEKENNVTIVI